MNLTKSERASGPRADAIAGRSAGPQRTGAAGAAGLAWALARYLVGRALADAIGRALLLVGLVLVGLCVIAAQLLRSAFLAVVLAVLAAGVLLLRALLRALVRRLTSPRIGGGPGLDRQLADLVADTRRDVLAELRRLGLPGRPWTLPLLGVRLLRRRTRRDTLDRLRKFDVDRVVPGARLDRLRRLVHRPSSTAEASDGVPPGPVIVVDDTDAQQWRR